MVQPVGSSIQPVTFVPIQPVPRVGAALVEQAKQALAQLQQPLPLPQTQALTTAVAQAAGRQDGLAPLMADLGQALETPDIPAPVRAAAAEVLKLQTPLRADMAAPAVRQAVSQSGLFLEARLATAPERPPGPDLKAALLVLRQVLVQATPAQAQAAAPAASPAPRAAPAPSAALPAPAAPAIAGPPSIAPQASTTQPAASATEALRPSASPVETPQSSTPQAAASASSGTAAPKAGPAPLAAAVPASTAPLATAPAPDAARPAAPVAATAAEASTDQPIEAAPMRGPAPSPATNPTPAAAPPAATLATLAAVAAKAPSLPLPQALPLPSLSATASASAAAEAVAARDGLPPPYRGGPVRAQRAATPTLSPGAAATTVTASLLKQTDAALAREELLQAASMPEGPRQTEADPQTARSEPARWMLDIPLTTPQGPAVAQMEISRDGRAPGAAPTDAPVWRVRFSIDAEPLGPVHAAVVMQGGQAHVGLWAERPDSAADLRGRMGELTSALSEAADAVEVSVYTGAPPQAAPQAGRLVDQSS